MGDVVRGNYGLGQISYTNKDQYLFIDCTGPLEYGKKKGIRGLCGATQLPGPGVAMA